MSIIPFKNPEVKTVFDSYPEEVREKLLVVRELIFKTASDLKGVGKLDERLRWGEPSYITNKTKSGSIIRVHHNPKKNFDFGVYFHCQTNLVFEFRQMFPKTFRFDGNRCLEFMVSDKLPTAELRKCFEMALTYNLSKKK